MRIALSIGVAVSIAWWSVLVAPVSAQSSIIGGGAASGGQIAGFSCGSEAGTYGMTNAAEEMFPGGGTTVPALYWQIQYAGVPAPTTIGVIRYYNDMQSFQNVATFSAQSSGGTIEGAVRANISPEAQGAEGSLSPRAGRADGPVTSQRGAGGSVSSGYGGGGGLMPGEYIFDVYTGEMRQTAEGTMFVADPRGYLGTFSCGVSD
jgi:hypothetical protein